MKSLSVIIVNYQSEEDILRCLTSAFQFSSAAHFEWIIVNNDTGSTKKQEVLQKFPAITWVDMNYNAGFARANNQGIRQTQSDAVLLLNADTLILDDAISLCFSRLMASANIAAAVQLLNEDYSTQITGNFFMKGGLNHLLPLPYLGRFLRTLAFAGGAKKTNVASASAEEQVDWISGAFLMVKRIAIEKAGLLDEDFFLYSEEIEWCSRLKKAGTLCVYGDLKTIHLQGESINKATGDAVKGYGTLHNKKGLQLLVSQHLRIRKQFGKGWFLFHLLIHTFEIPVFFFGSLLAGVFRFRNPFSRMKEVCGYSKNVLVLWQLLPDIYANKQRFYKMLGE